MTFRMPCFFLLLDSWLGSALGAGVDVFAGCAALESPVLPVAAGWAGSVEAGAGSVADVELAGAVREFGLPGVTVSTVAEDPILDPVAAPALGCKLKPIVSSPDSLAGVMVGGPL